MANDLNAIMLKILARGLMVMRERCWMPRVVRTDFGADAARKGKTIDVPISVPVGTVDITPSNTQPANVDTTMEMVQIQLDKWRGSDPIHLSDKELVEVDQNEHFLPLQLEESVRGLARYVNQQIHQAAISRCYSFSGTAGTTPFADVTSATTARKLLNQQVTPQSNRVGVLNWDAEANASALSAFHDASVTLSNELIIEGEIGRKFGINWVADDDVVDHTTSAAGTPLVQGGSQVVGSKTLQADGFSTKPEAGDIFTIAGNSQQYVVESSTTLSGSSSTLTIYPGLAASPADNAAITFVASHAANIVMHRDAVAFAMRPLEDGSNGLELGNRIAAMTDPISGIPLRLEVSRQHKQVTWQFDVLFGVKAVRPEYMTRILG